jgi:GH15 family glucan-1,4-alpha-glucosidase
MRVDGFVPISHYAAIGDGRSVALVARDGDIDWLCLPRSTSPPAFAALLDPERGGRARLAPVGPHEVSRRYLEDTNVLETTYTTADGEVRVTDSMNLDGGTTPPWSELARRIECLRGAIRMRWEVRPCEGARAAVRRRGGVTVLCLRDVDLAVHSWDAGAPHPEAGGVGGELRLAAGQSALLALTATCRTPIAAPAREEVERRLEWTVQDWRRVAGACQYEGPWAPEVRRSALALHLLVDAARGMLVGAPTTSLPERIGGDRNFDYRYGWVRDCSFALDAVMALGYRAQAHATLAWLLDVTSRTHPRLQPLYGMDGNPRAPQSRLDLRGYRDSSPVRAGNRAYDQRQLGAYGEFLDTVLRYVREGNALDDRTAQRLAEVADFVCRIWRNPDSGIWELPAERQYTTSKIGCWMALDRAIELARRGAIPARHVSRWGDQAAEIRTYVLTHCWSVRQRSLSFHAGTDKLDASVLLAAFAGFFSADDRRFVETVQAVERELGAGPFLYRYSGMREQEGAFLACSFWMVNALAYLGRLDEAAERMDALCDASNDVGLLSEEVDPATGALLGNFPQALSHLALANAAVALAERTRATSARRSRGPTAAALGTSAARSWAVASRR